jgi:peptidoglycan-N-acetylglucosamine deacetylase
MRFGPRAVTAAVARVILGSTTHVRTGDRVAALTFDDGPDPDVTPALLDVLGTHNARGTFFVVGQAALRHRGIVERMVREGHAVSNHTFDHSPLPDLSTWACFRQIREGGNVLPRGQKRYFRPPWGQQSLRTRIVTALAGHDVVTWNLDPGDYTEATAAEIRDALIAGMTPGAIALLHDARFNLPEVDQRKTVEAVEGALEHFDGDFQFVTVPELIERGSRQRINWYR